MSFEILNKAIGMLDADIIEAAEAAPERRTSVTAFAKPWMKWAVAAILIVVIGVGTPVALNMMGAFRNENFVAPGGSGNSGFIAPADGSSESGSGQSPEGESSSKADEPSLSSSQPGGSSAETPDLSSSGTPESDVPEQPEGDFVKENMPAVTYRINGEYKTFDYQSSTAVVDSGSSYVIDHYVGSDGSTVSANAGTGELVKYEKDFSPKYLDSSIFEAEAVETAKSIAVNTAIGLSGLDNANSSVECSDDKFFVVLSVAEGSVEICLDSEGGLVSFAVKRNP